MSSGDKDSQGPDSGANSKPAQNPAPPQPFGDLRSESAHIQEHGVAMNEATLGVDHSLVPDLMRVYQNMSVSKTPQTRSSAHGTFDSGVSNDVPHDAMEPLPMNDGSLPIISQQWHYGNIPIPAPYPVSNDAHNMAEEHQYATEEPSPVQADSSSSVDQPSSTRKRPSRDSSSTGSTKRRKKSSKDKKDQDGRWTKRFTWPDELHRDFVSAIFDIGLKHATPSSVLEQMPPLEQITTERIKSHLQKYRLHRRKSKQEFMSCYEETVERLKATGGKGISSLSGGQAAGYVSHAVDTQPDVEGHHSSQDAGRLKQGTSNPLSQVAGAQDGDTVLTIPRLTEDEKQSPVGASLGYLIGLFFSLKRQLQEHRNPTTNRSLDHNGGTVTVPHGSASRSNLEAGSLMKREMESQMAFQNKMRALKQEELSKLAEVPCHGDGGTKPPAFLDAPSPTNHQRPGEAVEPSTKNRSASEDEEFWKSTAFDGELFDFLME